MQTFIINRRVHSSSNSSMENDSLTDKDGFYYWSFFRIVGVREVGKFEGELEYLSPNGHDRSLSTAWEVRSIIELRWGTIQGFLRLHT